MCFSVSLTRESFERDPRFHYLLQEFPGDFPTGRGYHYFGFQHPLMPLLCTVEPSRALPASWGLIPSWAAQPEKALSIRSKTLNARSETLAEKPSFRGSWPEKRCLIPVEGFYEPHKGENGSTPWYITRRDRGLFFLGGIYQDTPPGLTGPADRTFSVLTVPLQRSYCGSAQWKTPDASDSLFRQRITLAGCGRTVTGSPGSSLADGSVRAGSLAGGWAVF